MKETDGWVKIKKYTDAETLDKMITAACDAVHGGLYRVDAMKAIEAALAVWRGESKSEWQPIETAPKDKPLLLSNGEDVGIGFAAEDGDPEYASMWMPLPSPPQEK